MKKSLALHEASGTLGFYYNKNSMFVPFESQPLLKVGKLPVSGFAPNGQIFKHIVTECEQLGSRYFPALSSGIVSLIEKNDDVKDAFVVHVINKLLPETVEFNIAF